MSWPDLVSVALLGTERREPPVPAGQALAALADGGNAEERLLSAAGSLAVIRRAGRLARPAPPRPAPAPAEALPACGPAAASRLALLLGDHRALLPEWLRLLARRGLRLPAERLPDLLEAATASQALRGDVEAVLGERGRWLAAQAPRWGWAAPLPASGDERQALWLTGSRLERHRLFAALRRSQPAAARELLAGGLSREEGADRAWFVAALAEGLAADDEPLLESALDDRRQEVRAAAARLLARLPGSGLARRMTGRTVPLVRVEGRAQRWLNVALPEGLAESAVRDGIVRRPPRGTGERAWWLLQLVAATPLSAWDAVGLSPELAATLPVSGELEAELRQGFARAAEAQQDPRWAAAFLHAAPGLAEFAYPERAMSVAVDRLREGDTDIAERFPAPWPLKLSQGALVVFAGHARRGHWWLSRLIAERLDLALADDAARGLENIEPGPASIGRARELIKTLSFRKDMYEELK